MSAFLEPHAAGNPSLHQRHVVELQSMRGIASTVVLFGHCLAFFTAPAWFRTIQSLPNGHGAFVFFFVLSGYVLALSLEHEPLTRTSVGRFYVKRLFRIYPAVWAAVVFAMLYIPWHYGLAHPFASSWFMGFYPHDQFNTVHIVGTAFAIVFFAIPPLGTIATELAASALMPFMFLCARRGIAAALVTIAGLLAFSIMFGERTPHTIGIYFVDFMLGICLAVFRVSLREHIVSIGPFSKIVAGFALVWLLLNFALLPRADYADPVSQAIEAVAASIVIAMVAYRIIDLPFLRSTPLRRLGDISYSLYLVHFTVMAIIGTCMGYLGREMAVPFDGAVWNCVLALIVLAVAIPISILSYEIVEKGGIKAGDRVIVAMNLHRRKSL